MGRGDKRTRKGKTFRASYGNSRSHSKGKKVTFAATKPAAKKTPTKAPKK